MPLKDFYSHSNWIELGNLFPYSNLIRPDSPIDNIAGIIKKKKNIYIVCLLKYVLYIFCLMHVYNSLLTCNPLLHLFNTTSVVNLVMPDS